MEIYYSDYIKRFTNICENYESMLGRIRKDLKDLCDILKNNSFRYPSRIRRVSRAQNALPTF